MIALERLLSVQEELDLFLTIRGVKPACSVEIDRGKNPGALGCFVAAVQLGYYLLNEDVFFRYGFKTSFYGEGFHYNFKVGSTRCCLALLTLSRGNIETGIALGYPQEAIDSYQKVIDGVRRDTGYLHFWLSLARQAEVDIPTWLAYISFIPERLDLDGGDVSQTSRELGELYQAFVRRENPSLAGRVEADFQERIRSLPTAWRVDERDRSYVPVMEQIP